MDAALAQTLATRHGTPFYAYDLAVVKDRAQQLFAALPAGASVCYSFKANPMPAIARQVRLAGCRAEITSEGELAAAQAAGFTGAQMLFGVSDAVNGTVVLLADGYTARFTPTTVGEYPFFCKVGGHSKKGMTGTIVVVP